MVDFGKEFDESIDKAKALWNRGRKDQLEMLLREIDTYSYTTFAELKGAIHNHLELIEEKVDGDD